MTCPAVDLQPRIHEKRSRKYLSRLLVLIIGIGVKSAQFYFQTPMIFTAYRNQGEHSPRLVGGNELPCRHARVFKRGNKPVKVSPVHEFVISVILPYLTANDPRFVFGKFCGIEFQPESSPSCDIAFSFVSRSSVCGNVRTHRRGGITHRCAELDIKPIDRIGVVARPDLRRITKHRGVVPSAAAGTVLKQNVRKSCYEPVHEVISA